MRRFILYNILLVVACMTCVAQGVTPSVTVYKEFRPATIYMSNGKKVKVQLANIFLKNSSLLFMRDGNAMEATMNTINRVEFADRTYYRQDTLLVYQVDTVGNDALYCAEMIDMDAYQQRVRNNSQVSSLSLGDVVGVTTVDIGEETDFPIKAVYFYRLNGKTVKVHERQLKLVLNKEQRRLMSSVMNTQGFSWSDPQCLLRLLKTIQQ